MDAPRGDGAEEGDGGARVEVQVQVCIENLEGFGGYFAGHCKQLGRNDSTVAFRIVCAVGFGRDAELCQYMSVGIIGEDERAGEG